MRKYNQAELDMSKDVEAFYQGIFNHFIITTCRTIIQTLKPLSTKYNERNNPIHANPKNDLEIKTYLEENRKYNKLLVLLNKLMSDYSNTFSLAHELEFTQRVLNSSYLVRQDNLEENNETATKAIDSCLIKIKEINEELAPDIESYFSAIEKIENIPKIEPLSQEINKLYGKCSSKINNFTINTYPESLKLLNPLQPPYDIFNDIYKNELSNKLKKHHEKALIQISDKIIKEGLEFSIKLEQQKKELEKKTPLINDQQQSQLKEEPTNLLEKKNNQANQTIEQIDTILDQLQSDIGGINPHHFKDAKNVASILLKELEEARNTLKKSFKTNLRENNPNHEAQQIFNDACRKAVKKAKPVLEKDLGWGDYLANLLKSLANAVVWCLTLGNSNSFFPYAKSTSLETVKTAKEDLQNVFKK